MNLSLSPYFPLRFPLFIVHSPPLCDVQGEDLEARTPSVFLLNPLVRESSFVRLYCPSLCTRFPLQLKFFFSPRFLDPRFFFTRVLLPSLHVALIFSHLPSKAGIRDPCHAYPEWRSRQSPRQTPSGQYSGFFIAGLIRFLSDAPHTPISQTCFVLRPDIPFLPLFFFPFPPYHLCFSERILSSPLFPAEYSLYNPGFCFGTMWSFPRQRTP